MEGETSVILTRYPTSMHKAPPVWSLGALSSDVAMHASGFKVLEGLQERRHRFLGGERLSSIIGRRASHSLLNVRPVVDAVTTAELGTVLIRCAHAMFVSSCGHVVAELPYPCCVRGASRLVDLCQ